jgi:hypothetical protein
MTCVPDWGDYDDALLCKAVDLAWSTLRVLSGGQVGNCPVLVRPYVAPPCTACAHAHTAHLAHVGSCGNDCWRNTCGGDGCSCTPLPEIVLPGPIAEVWQIKIDGELLLVEQYRVDNGNRLLRTDGLPWPSCQTMIGDADDDPGTMGVWYVPGVVPSSAGLWAAGVLTGEFMKACSGGKCRLPSAVTSISRQGVSMDFSTGMFPDGMTGIREVDAYLTAINPYALRTPPRVWSPDLVPAKHRYTTWQARPETVPADPWAGS